MERRSVNGIFLGGDGDWAKRTLPGAIEAGIKPKIIVGTRTPEEGQSFMNSLGIKDALYLSPKMLEEVMAKHNLGKDAVAIVMSPPLFHSSGAILASKLGFENIMIEKPLGLSVEEITTLKRKTENSKLYSNDHYLVAKALPLWWFLGASYAPGTALESLNRLPLKESYGAFDQIGKITEVEARLVEGGQASDGRMWLAEPTMGGGVLFDLKVHLDTILVRLNLLNKDTKINKLKANVHDGLKWRPVSRTITDDFAEMLVETKFITNDIPTEMAIGKIGGLKHINRGKYIKVTGEHGYVFLDLENSKAKLKIEGKEEFIVKLKIKPYTFMWQAFLMSINRMSPDNLHEGLTSIELSEKMRSYNRLNLLYPDVLQKNERYEEIKIKKKKMKHPKHLSENRKVMNAENQAISEFLSKSIEL